MEYEQPPTGRYEYAVLDEDAIHAYCYRLDTVLEQAPTELRSTTDVTVIKHVSSYVGLTESGGGELVPVEHAINIRATHYATGPLRRQYEVLVGVSVRRSPMPIDLNGDALDVHPQVVENDYGSHEAERRVDGYIFVEHRDGSLNAYTQSPDPLGLNTPAADREMVLYDALYLEDELDNLEAITVAAAHEDELAGS